MALPTKKKSLTNKLYTPSATHRLFFPVPCQRTAHDRPPYVSFGWAFDDYQAKQAVWLTYGDPRASLLFSPVTDGRYNIYVDGT